MEKNPCTDGRKCKKTIQETKLKDGKYDRKEGQVQKVQSLTEYRRKEQTRGKIWESYFSSIEIKSPVLILKEPTKAEKFEFLKDSN